jgi:hypothetical protein
LKYSEEVSSCFMNLKKHEFLVKKLRRKLQACQSYLERQQDENLAGILQFVLN